MRSKFKLILLGFSILFFASCGNGKEAVSTNQTESVTDAGFEETVEVVNDEIGMFVDAVVLDKSTNEGCGFILQRQNADGNPQLLEPLSLDDKYKIDGLKIQVRYTPSRRQSLCSLSSMPITIDEIKLK